MNDETKLPKWAREELARSRSEADRLRKDLETIKQAHGLLFGREWFTVQGPKPGQQTWTDGRPATHYRLWLLDRDSPHPVCELGVGDVLLVGRKPKEGGTP